jgi:TRAP-type C4-dicarboxylate transport system substrate-binding protein
MVSWKKMYKECEYELEQYKVVMNILYDDLPKMLRDALSDAVKKAGEVKKVDEETLETTVDLFVDSAMLVFEEYVAGDLASRLEEVIEPIAEEIVKRLVKKGVVDKITRKLLEDQRIKRVYEECRKAISEY